MKPAIDIIFLIGVSVAIGIEHPALGALFALANFVFATQYWKTLLLLGGSATPLPISRHVKAATLAAFLAAVLFVASEFTAEPKNGGNVNELWNGDAFGMVLSILFLSSLLMASLVTEKRKR